MVDSVAVYKVRIIQLFWGRLQSLYFDAIPLIIMCNKPRGWLKIQAEIRRYYKGKSSNPTLGQLSARHPYISRPISLSLPHPYPAIGLPLRANRIPAPFFALSRHLNIVLFCDNNVTLLPQNALFSLDFIQKHRIIVQFQAISPHTRRNIRILATDRHFYRRSGIFLSLTA